jgi:hypothetical protein
VLGGEFGCCRAGGGCLRVRGGQQAAEPLDLVGAERRCGVDHLADVFGEDVGAVGSGIGGRAAWWAVGFVWWVGGGLVGAGSHGLMPFWSLCVVRGGCAESAAVSAALPVRHECGAGKRGAAGWAQGALPPVTALVRGRYLGGLPG